MIVVNRWIDLEGQLRIEIKKSGETWKSLWLTEDEVRDLAKALFQVLEMPKC